MQLTDQGTVQESEPSDSPGRAHRRGVGPARACVGAACLVRGVGAVVVLGVPGARRGGRGGPGRPWGAVVAIGGREGRVKALYAPVALAGLLGTVGAAWRAPMRRRAVVGAVGVRMHISCADHTRTSTLEGA